MRGWIELTGATFHPQQINTLIGDRDESVSFTSLRRDWSTGAWELKSLHSHWPDTGTRRLMSRGGGYRGLTNKNITAQPMISFRTGLDGYRPVGVTTGDVQR